MNFIYSLGEIFSMGGLQNGLDLGCWLDDCREGLDSFVDLYFDLVFVPVSHCLNNI